MSFAGLATHSPKLAPYPLYIYYVDRAWTLSNSMTKGEAT